tara:strand:- start:101 stop:433 length:333 start_codon:yes stop_codon:yes gene_type:complete
VLHFSPEHLGWPTLYFDDWTEDGLTLHEISEIEEADQNPEFPMPKFIARTEHGKEIDQGRGIIDMTPSLLSTKAYHHATASFAACSHIKLGIAVRSFQVIFMGCAPVWDT